MAKTSINGKALKALLGAGVARVSQNVALINELNVFPVPDGDTGINLYHTLRRAWQEIAALEDAEVCLVAERFAFGALMGARGNSGTIFSQLLTGFAEELKHEKTLTTALLLNACQTAVARAYASVSEPVEGTLLTVARESTENLQSAATLDEIITSIVSAAQISLDNTPNLLPLLRDAGVVDAGGMGLLCFLQGVQQQHCGARFDMELPVVSENRQSVDVHIPTESYGYDVQFLMLGDAMDVNAVRRDIEQLGWSVIVAGDESRIKVHIHVENPALPLDYAVKTGAALDDIVVENMQLQAKDFASRRELRASDAAFPEVAVIAVADGDGMQAVFRELDCALVIDGGAGKNPATEDFVAAIEQIRAEKIIILPNNRNIVLAAQQAAKLAGDKQVTVIKTRTMLEGVNAMIACGDSSDKLADLDAMKLAMQEAIAATCSIEITRATRSTQIRGLEIRQNDYIALIDGENCVASANIASALTEAFTKIGIDHKELATLYYGAEISREAVDALIERLLIAFEGLEYEAIYGGQALYPLLVSVE